MNLLSRTFYVPASTADAYYECKSLLFHGNSHPKSEQFSLIEDKPDEELHWLSRWGIAHIDGRANFIPAQGGCVVHVSISSIGALSRLVLSIPAPLARGPWRRLNALPQLGRR